jgi:hypothetical protein
MLWKQLTVLSCARKAGQAAAEGRTGIALVASGEDMHLPGLVKEN